MRGRVGDIKYEEDRYTKDDKELLIDEDDKKGTLIQEW